MNGNKPLYDYLIAPAIETVIANVTDSIAYTLEGNEGYTSYRGEVEWIEHECKSGFIPWTDGGFIGWTYADTLAVWARSQREKTWPQPLRDILTAMYESSFLDCVNIVREKNGLEELKTYREAFSFYTDKIWGSELQESFEEVELEYYSSADADLYAIKAWCIYRQDEPDGPSISFMVSVNCDFEYYRRNIPWLSYYNRPTLQEYELYDETFLLEELTPEKLIEIQEEMIQSF